MTWGQKVAAVIVLETDSGINGNDLKLYLQDKLAKHKIPSVFKFVPKLSRNLMGKVNKKDILNEIFSKEMKIM